MSSLIVYISSGLSPRHFDLGNKGIDQEFRLFCSNIEQVQFQQKYFLATLERNTDSILKQTYRIS